MQSQTTVVRVVIASPGDLHALRDRIHTLFGTWNNRHTGVHLTAIMWESASVPAMGDHPQSILNEQLLKESDLLVGIFWTKLGTPTNRAGSGTIEEIQEFIRTKGPRRVMIYFCRKSIDQSLDQINAAEIARLQDFKKDMSQQGLYAEFGEIPEFELALYQHLDAKVPQLIAGELPEPSLAQLSPTIAGPTQQGIDPRLQKPLDFGATLEEIANGFTKSMIAFDAIPGGSPDKFLDLGAHTYYSVAQALDRYTAISRHSITPENQLVLDKISARLKTLATSAPSYLSRFPKFWDDGRDICSSLRTHVSFLKGIKAM